MDAVTGPDTVITLDEHLMAYAARLLVDGKVAQAHELEVAATYLRETTPTARMAAEFDVRVITDMLETIRDSADAALDIIVANTPWPDSRPVSANQTPGA